jgi:hypothetical protein
VTLKTIALLVCVSCSMGCFAGRSVCAQDAPSLLQHDVPDDAVRTKPGKWAESIAADLEAQRYDELDSMAEQFRRAKSRVAGGGWRLKLFYEALNVKQPTDATSEAHLDQLATWVKARPQSVTARVALADALSTWAWVARGSGEADTITPRGEKLFFERLNRAQEVLEQTRSPVNDPQYYSAMMKVGLGQNFDAEKMRKVFEAGVALEPTFFYLYKEYANYLLPKWDGKPGEGAAFAKNSADRVGVDGGDLLYFQIGTTLVHRGNGNLHLGEIDWPRLKRGYAALAATYKTTRTEDNQFAYMAWEFRDAPVLQEQLAMIGDGWSPSVWSSRKVFDRAREWASTQPKGL